MSPLIPLTVSLVSVASVEPQGLQRGYLFSAISFSDSPLGHLWTKLRPEAQVRFPRLKMKAVEDLHITVVYLGGDWKVEHLEVIRAHALVQPQGSFPLTVEPVFLGRNSQVVALDLQGIPPAWSQSVVAAKGQLASLGLRKADEYDKIFRAHISLAESYRRNPDDSDMAELKAFRLWIESRLRTELKGTPLNVGTSTPVLLLLAGATRNENGPDYQPLEAFLAAHKEKFDR